MSVCNNLRQYGIKYSLTTTHTISPDTTEFANDLRRFVGACRVVRKLRSCRLGAIGARPGAFNTVRYSEKLFENSGITVETLDLSEILGWTAKMSDADTAVKQKLAAIQQYTDTGTIPQLPVIKMAKLGVAIDRWVERNGLDATAIQCWTSLEEFYGLSLAATEAP